MARPIKFRSWDKHDKRMIRIDTFQQIPANWEQCWDLMQFTGLLDKNGKEIYEGDLITITGFDWQNETISIKREVEWSDDGGYWVDVDDFDDEESLQLLGCLKLIALEIEVIGNLHENPELLK